LTGLIRGLSHLPPFHQTADPNSFRITHGIVFPTQAALQPTQTLEIHTAGKFVTQEDGVLDVTVVRKAIAAPNFTPSAAERRDHASAATIMANAVRRHFVASAPVLDQPTTVTVSAAFNSTGPADRQLPSEPAAGDGASTPTSVSVTFPAGVTSETVHVPISAGAASTSPGIVPVWISATSTTGPSTGEDVYLLSGPDAVPPTMTSAQVIKTGRHASGISIAFSKPMMAATVENVHNYVVTSLQEGSSFPNPLASIVPVGYSIHVRHYAIKSARYDPSTMTVTLIPAQPVTSSNGYSVGSAKDLSGHVITDLEGNPLYESGVGSMNGKFLIVLNGRPLAKWSPTAST
jgi:hypothetical protein